MRRLRTIVIGVGHLGRVHARILSKLPGVRLMGVVDPDPAARNAALEICRTTAFAHYNELDGKFDAAVIATPTSHHHGVARELLSRGVHLLVEKPLALTASEADGLVEAARRANVVLAAGHVERFNPVLDPVRQFVRKPRFIQARRTSAFTCRSTDIGVVMDVMIHDIDLALNLAGSPVRSVRAWGQTIIGPQEDVAHAHLEFENGCMAALTASRVSPWTVREMDVWSDAGFTSIDFATRRASVAEHSEVVRQRGINVAAMTPEEKDQFRQQLFTEHLPVHEHEGQPRDQLTAELENFVLSIREGQPLQVPGEQGRDAIHVAEGIIAQIAAGAVHSETSTPETAPLETAPLETAPSSNDDAPPVILPGPHWHGQVSHENQREAV